MAKELERDLGLVALVTISVGAMTGPGLFVLPGIAASMAGHAVVLAYVIAGLMALPAALSKAELATAMPGAGGPYLYLDRALGPMMGTIAGLGAWLSLLFKSAFALVGLGAYLALAVQLGAGSLKLVALGIAALLVVVNVVGVKETGTLQILIVSGVLLVLTLFGARGLTAVDAADVGAVLAPDAGGLVAAAGFVYVSFIGIMKIASIAEEVEDPSRNLPRGILLSLAIVLVIYPILILVLVSVVPLDQLGTSITPMADAAAAMPGWGQGALVAGVTGAAIAALVSMANAGLLAASRFPFALGRDDLAPEGLAGVSERFGTPVSSIGLTGVLLLVLIAALPVERLAKLASAFLILVFVLMNVALIAFREGSSADYDPSFRSPLYPWVQIVGIAGGLVLMVYLGTLPILGSGAIVLVGFLVYQFYGRHRAEREGAATGALRKHQEDASLDETKDALWQKTAYRVLIPAAPTTTREQEAGLIRLAAALVRGRGGHVQVVRFEEVPDQMSLRYAAREQTEADLAFEGDTQEAAEETGVQVEADEVVTHDLERALANYCRHHLVDVALVEVDETGGWSPLIGSNVEVLLEDLPCTTVFVVNRGIEDLDEIALVSDRGPFDPAKVALANAAAISADATIRFLYAVPASAPDEQVENARAYVDSLREMCGAATEAEVYRGDDGPEPLLERLEGSDLVLMSAHRHGILRTRVLDANQEEICRGTDATVLLVHDREDAPGLVQRIISRVLY